MEMTKEQMEFVAKSATDSYFSNLSNDAKLLAMSDTAGYVRDYTKFYTNALKEIFKYNQEMAMQEQREFEQFGFGNPEKDNAKAFR